ncbi:MAG TPA: STAS domain-containing protein [Luteimonas sp.]|nr:STAS domain-containing protein [Luteimonas sp.]
MPSAEAVSLTRDADALRFGGELLTPRIRDTWTRALPMLAGVRRFDVAGVTHVDSAGIALLAELAQRAGGVAIDGDPAGLSALRAAYRLTPALGYAA